MRMTRAHLLQQQFRVRLCPNAKCSDFFVQSLADKGAGDGDMSKTWQNFAPSVAERRRVQVPSFIARAENHKIAGFTRSG